jgi:ribosomal protein L7/L12
MSNGTATEGKYDELLSAELQSLRASGRQVGKILLIKRLRDHSGLGLKEAKDVVDDFCARNCPELAAPPSASIVAWHWLQFVVAVAAGLALLVLGTKSLSHLPEAWLPAIRAAAWIVFFAALVAYFRAMNRMAQQPSPLGQHDDLLTAELEALRQQGRGDRAYILLIKRLREKTGLGLKQAKDVVDDFRQRRGL